MLALRFTYFDPKLPLARSSQPGLYLQLGKSSTVCTRVEA
jgi:hypothetical protein